MDMAGRKLKEVHNRYEEKSREFDCLYKVFTKTSQVIKKTKTFTIRKSKLDLFIFFSIFFK